MIGNRQDIPRYQSDFYRDNYHRLLRWLLRSMVIILLLIAAIIYKLIFVAPHQYYLTTTAGQIVKMEQKYR